MHKKIQEVLENILQDKNETDKFLKMESADEVYDYFVEKISNLSEEEFENFMIDTLETYIHEQGKTQKLDPDALSNVSGGVSLPKRFAAGVISILTLMPSASGLETSKSIPDKAPSYFSIAKDNAKHVKFQVSNRFRGLGRLIKENPIIPSIVTAAILAVIIITVVLVRKHKKSKIQSQVGTGSMFQTPIQGATENSGSATHTPTHGENLDGAQQTTTPPGQSNRSASQSAPTAPGSPAQQTTSNPEQPSALPKPTLQGAPATPPRKQPTNSQHHSATPMPTGGKVRPRITVEPHTRVSPAPNPRSAPSGTSIPTHANIPTANQPTPPPLPAPLPSSQIPGAQSTGTSQQGVGGKNRSSGRGSHRRQNATLTTSSGAGSSDTEKSPGKYRGVNAVKKQLLAAANPPPATSPTNGSTHRTAVSDTIRALQRKVGKKAVSGLNRQQPAANSRPSSPASTSSGAATSETPIPSVSARSTRPRRPDKLPDGYDRAAKLFEQYLYNPTFRGSVPTSNSEYNRLRGELLRTIPANGKIPGATSENGAAEVIGFLRNGPMALNNAFAKMRKGEVLVCMQIRGHEASETNNDKYAMPSR